MYLGIVKGTVVAARKASGLEGQKLLLVQPVDEHGGAVGDLQAAVDTVQAGVGDLVYLVGSREAALALGAQRATKRGGDPAGFAGGAGGNAPRGEAPWFVPVDAAIVGIVDGIDAPAPAPGAKGAAR